MRTSAARAMPPAAKAAICLWLLMFFLAPCAAHSPATRFDPYAGPRPLAVFIETEPQLLVAGSDMPRVAVYENGDIVFARISAGGMSYRRAQLDRRRLAELRSRLHAVTELKGLSARYDLQPGATGLPETRFYLRDAGRETAVAVHGWRDPPAPAAKTKEAVVRVPPALAKLRDWFRGVDIPDAQAWNPKYVEVMLWPNPEASDESIVWPPEWPSLRSTRAMTRGQMVSIYLDGSALPALRDFLATQRPKGAVLIGGRKMAVDFRYVFPSEPIWRKAFNATTPKAAMAPAGNQVQ